MGKDITSELKDKLNKLMELSLQDIKVELADEFDRNFERGAFFTDKWARRKYNDDESRQLLVDTGTLRSSITDKDKFATKTKNSVIFETSVPYAKIHNDGGTIIVTKRMKAFFCYKYKAAIGARTFKRNGSQRNNKKNRLLNSDAEFYRAMALKPIGSKIIIPKRQFIGKHPEVNKILKEIIENNIQTVFK